MVEKIIISPESIRGLGNIVMPKTGADFEEYNCTMEVGEDTVNGEDVPVYVLTPETTTISLVLSSSVDSCGIGDSVVLSVTVTEDSVPVSGASVSFKLGGTEIGTGTTNSSGVATYTYTTVSSGSLNFSAVYGGHSSNGVSVVVNKKTVTATISASSASIVVGGSVTLTGTVKYNNSGVSGIPVTFKEGTSTVGTGTTNSSGVATCTVSDLTVGSHSFTVTSTATDVYDTGTSSSTSVTVLDHSYSLAFSQSSYVATGGSATLECTLLDNNVPVEGATISVSGSDSSLYTGITNTDGIASINVNVSAQTTFTCSYSNVTDTCTVTTSSVIYQPALDGTETKKQITGTTTIANGVMTCGASYLSDGWDNTGNWKLTFEAQLTPDQSALGIYKSGETQRDKNMIKITGNYHKNITSYTNGSSESSKTTSVPVSTWFAIECVKNGNSLTATWNNNSYTVTWTQLTTLSKVCIGVDTWGQCASIRNIKVESL